MKDIWEKKFNFVYSFSKMFNLCYCAHYPSLVNIYPSLVKDYQTQGHTWLALSSEVASTSVTQVDSGA